MGLGPGVYWLNTPDALRGLRESIKKVVLSSPDPSGTRLYEKVLERG
jgi:hypothetical protein